MKCFLLSTFVLILLNSCKSTTEPNDKPVKLENYQWISDTLIINDYTQILMESIYGDDVENVYVCGHSSATDGELWKYNGNEWKVISYAEYQSKSGRPDLINGFSSNDFYLGGRNNSKPFLMSSNGYAWKNIDLNIFQGRVKSICCTENQLVYVGMDNSQIAYFNGSEWKVEKLTLDVTNGTQCLIKSIVGLNDEIHLLVQADDQSEEMFKYWYIKGEFGNWNIVSQFQNKYYQSKWEFGIDKLTVIDNNIYSFGPGIYLLNGDKWERRFLEINDQIPISAIHSFNNNQFVLVGSFGDAFFFDGIALKRITDLPKENILYTDIEIIENTIFISGYKTAYPYCSIIFKGSQE